MMYLVWLVTVDLSGPKKVKPRTGYGYLQQVSASVQDFGKPCPVKMPDGVLVLMVCGREGGTSVIKLPERDDIADRLMSERLALSARRYMRDIRLAAVIDVRV